MSPSHDDGAFPHLGLAGGSQRRQLLLILGDQLDPRYLGHAGFDPHFDAVVMLEVPEEASHVPSHRARTALFLSAMRHFALDLRDRDIPVHYGRLDDPDNGGSFASELRRLATRVDAEALTVIRPGEWRVLDGLEAVAADLGWRFQMLEDPHFLSTPEEFSAWAKGRKQLVMEYFYRQLRKRTGLLMDDAGKPEGGEWNYDKQNRKALGKRAPDRPEVPRFEPDAVTLGVLELVERRFPDAPGSLDGFAWPVTRGQALIALEDFLVRRLPHFGDYQDAMKRGEPWLFHSLLAPALNLKLLDPREVMAGALERYRSGDAPLNAVEGFVRQILGWREFIRGVYWHEGRDYGERNGLEADLPLPEMYWTGDTDMVCMRESLGQVLEHGYGHHIQRLMITGNYALLAGVKPRAVTDWYLGMYVDAVDWVTLPNTLGMMLHADGGVVGTKPYVASGRYVQRMGDYCGSCRYDPGTRTGEDACPFTTLYWDFLMRHRGRLGDNRRMAFAWKNLDRIDEDEQRAIRQHARTLRGLGAAGG
ncbi:MAG: cryptochrome/photolyase family protein [Acidobacteriota bacterium]